MNDLHAEELNAFVADVNADDIDAAVARLSRDFYEYVPREGEVTQPEALRDVLSGIRGGMPDGVLTTGPIEADGDEVVADAVLAGHYSGTAWGVPGHGHQFEVRGRLRSRMRDDGLALAAEGFDLAAVLRAAGIVPYLSFMHLKPEYPPLLPEVLWRLLFNDTRLEEKPCSHLDQIKVIEVTGEGCIPCDEEGIEYPRVRQCLTCGLVGCCDTSVNKHAMKHSQESGHMLIRSAIPGEGWIWCYEDKAILSSWHLQQAAAS